MRSVRRKRKRKRGVTLHCAVSKLYEISKRMSNKTSLGRGRGSLLSSNTFVPTYMWSGVTWWRCFAENILGLSPRWRFPAPCERVRIPLCISQIWSPVACCESPLWCDTVLAGPLTSTVWLRYGGGGVSCQVTRKVELRGDVTCLSYKQKKSQYNTKSLFSLCSHLCEYWNFRKILVYNEQLISSFLLLFSESLGIRGGHHLQPMVYDNLGSRWRWTWLLFHLPSDPRLISHFQTSSPGACQTGRERCPSFCLPVLFA